MAKQVGKLPQRYSAIYNYMSDPSFCIFEHLPNILLVMQINACSLNVLVNILRLCNSLTFDKKTKDLKTVLYGVKDERKVVINFAGIRANNIEMIVI